VRWNFAGCCLSLVAICMCWVLLQFLRLGSQQESWIESGNLAPQFHPQLSGCHHAQSVVQSAVLGISCVHCGRWVLSLNLTVGIEQFESHFWET